MLKKINASALATRLQSLRPSKQALLSGLRQGLIVPVVLVGVYVVFPLLRDGIPLSPQQRVEPLNQRINDLDKQIKASKTPSTTDLKEIATLEKGRIDSENTIRTSLFQAVGGLLVFVTLYISWLTLKANEAKQVAERFSKAVEQLGNDNIHVRLGGIYALEQIAKDAEEKYYWQVMETLTSYVRVRSPWNKEKEAQAEQDIPPLPIDIQAVMTVLARRKHSYGHPLERHPLDLHGTDLRRLKLPPNTQLNQANLARTNLQGAFLIKVNLQGAFLQEVKLQGAFLIKVNLQEAALKKANLQKANLTTANLQKASLVEANLQEAALGKADLQEANLTTANLQKASLVEANLRQTNFWGTNLQEADLWSADLRGAILMEADLQGTSLVKTIMRGANLQEAHLRESKFKKSIWGTRSENSLGLTWEQLDTAASYEGALLPDYLPPRSPQVEADRSPQSQETLTAALNAMRTLMVSYKNE